MRRSARWLVAAVLLASCAPVSKYKPRGEAIPYQGFHARLPSGLQVVVYEVPQVDRFSLTVSYGSGSAEDPEGKEGLAHLVEHLAFRTAPDGARGVPLWDQLTAAGWRFNAFTSWDSTDYYALGKPAELPEALRLEASRMRQPVERVDEAAFAVERDVVLAEYRERFETSPFGAQLQWLLDGAFPDHPYGRPVAGTPETLRAISLADARAWTAERYVPRNAIVVVVSPYPSRQVMRQLVEAFGDLAVPGGAEVGPRVAGAPPLPASVEAREPAVQKAPVRRPNVWVAWPVPGVGPHKDAQGEAAAAALQRAFGGVLYRSLGAHALQRVESWSAHYVPVGAHGLVLLNVVIANGSDAERMVELARSAAVELVMDDDGSPQDPLTVKERHQVIAETRDQLLVDAYLELERLQGSSVAAYLRATGEPDYLAGRRKTIAMTLNADISSYAAEFLKRDRSSSLVVLPDANSRASGLAGGEGAPGAASDDRDDLEDGGWAPPDPERVREVARPPGFASAARRVLPNGLTAYVVKRGTLPVAEVRLLLGTSVDGTASVPAGVPGFALSTNSSRFAAEGASRVGAARSIGVGRESVHYTTWGSSSNLEVLLESTAQWARDQKVRYYGEVEDVYLGWVESWERDPDALASRALLAGLFPGHPYSSVPHAKELARAGEGALAAFLDREFRPERATLYVVSNQPDGPELWAAIERHFGGWRRGSTPREAPPAPPPPARHLVLVHRPGASQAVVGVGLRLPAYAERDRPATRAVAWLAQHRLMKRLRHAEGVTYGAHVWLHDEARAGALMVSTAVARDATARSLEVALATAKALAEGGVTDAEAGRARWQVARGYAAAYDTVGESASALLAAGARGVPPEGLDAEATSIAALDAGRIKAAAATLPVGQESIVILGDAEVLLPQLQAAGFTPEVVKP